MTGIHTNIFRSPGSYLVDRSGNLLNGTPTIQNFICGFEGKLHPEKVRLIEPLYSPFLSMNFVEIENNPEPVSSLIVYKFGIIFPKFSPQCNK